MAVDPLAIIPIITNVGLAACFRAQGDGVHLELSHIAVGRGLPDGGGTKGYVPNRAMTGLIREDARVPLLSGSVLPDYGFRVLARVPATSDGTALPIREVAFLLSTGQPLAIWSEVADYPLAARTPHAEVDLAFDLFLSQIPLSVLNLVVQQPDIPDTAGVLAELLALQCEHFIGAMRLNWRFPLVPFDPPKLAHPPVTHLYTP